VHQPVQNGRTHRVVTQVFPPVLNNPVGGVNGCQKARFSGGLG
jgi:hypothetical protein